MDVNKKKILTRNGINYPNYIKINRNSSSGLNNIFNSKYLNKENYSKNISISKKEYSGNDSKRNEDTIEKLNSYIHKKYNKSNNNEPIKTGLTFESLLFNKENKHNEIKQNIIEKEKNNFIRKHKNKSLDNLEMFKRENIVYYNNNKINRGKLFFVKGKNYNKTLNLDESILNKKNVNSKHKIHLSDRNTIEKKDLTFENFLSFREDNFQREIYNYENNIKNKKEEKYINGENKNKINKTINLSSLTELDNRILNLEKNINSLNLNDLITEEYSIFKLNQNKNELENYEDYIQKSNDNFYNEINEKLKNIEEILLHK